jgi:hypothetical protein
VSGAQLLHSTGVADEFAIRPHPARTGDPDMPDPVSPPSATNADRHLAESAECFAGVFGGYMRAPTGYWMPRTVMARRDDGGAGWCPAEAHTELQQRGVIARLIGTRTPRPVGRGILTTRYRRGPVE